MFFKFILLVITCSRVLSLTDQDVHLRNHVATDNVIMENIATGKYTPDEEKDPEFWHSMAQRELDKRLASEPNYNRAKNIIFFLGDGMSLSTVMAARIRKGQLKGKTGEEESLCFEKFPWIGLSKTYCSNAQVADSACTATAYLCGVKANIMTIGVTANVDYNNCSMSMDPKNQVSSLADWAQKAGKSTGFITTTTLTHASPSGMYAHTANRFWECDTDILDAQEDPTTCMDMAQQLIKQAPGRNLDVMMGGGMGKFLPKSLKDSHGNQGERQDGLNLLSLWKEMHPQGAIVTNCSQLLNLDLKNTDKIMGIFASKGMDFHAHADNSKQPRLVEMTEVALKFLKQKNPNGYVIFIEGGLIDYGNHFNKPGLAIDETLEFEAAIAYAYNTTDPNDTLIVVTSDHAHPLSIAGFPGRGTNILGVNQHDVDSNGMKYATLNYALGPEQYLDAEGKSLDLEGLIGGIDSIHPSQIPSSIGVHAGDDVGIFASGPYSHLFSGVLEQNSIPHLMAYAAGLGGHAGANRGMMGNVATGKYTPPEEKNPEFWRSLAQRELARRLGSVPNYNRAKNIIFFLGDGMSLTTVTASRIRKGQLKGNTGEEDALSFEKFPWIGLSKTYCSNSQVADSACTATAYLCGVKANIMTIGVSANVDYNNCTMSMDPKNHVSSLADWAQKAGKSTGFVTTTTLTHASPSGTYAHTANRYWESDADVLADQQDPNTCMDMAQQLITQSPGRNLDVMMGGGMGKFIPNNIKDAHGNKGERKDGRHLLNLWKKNNPKGALVTNRKQLLNLNLKKVDKIIGTFGSQLMNFHALADNTKQPRLVEMTEVALKFLSQKNPNGYVIFIEGGLIDYGNHFNKPGLAIDETLEFEKAIELAVNITDPNETLIVVTSDHAHPLSIAGYPGRGTPILGVNHHDVDSNGKKYATLNYAVGPEQYRDDEGKSLDLEGLIDGSIDSIHPSQIPSSLGVHGGDDVGIFASGPFSHLFGGVLQQNSIPHLMAFAAGIGV